MEAERRAMKMVLKECMVERFEVAEQVNSLLTDK